MLRNFEAGRYGITQGSTWQQDALDYFGFEGIYDPSAPLFQKHGPHPAITDPVTGEIFYHDFPFEGNFDRLAFIANHEKVHRINVLSGKYEGVKITRVIQGLEEFNTYLHNYMNQGLYPNHGFNIVERLKVNEWQALRDYFTPKWWHFIYRIPRRW